MGSSNTVLMQTIRLQRFFANWHAARALDPPGLLAERLDRLFSAMRALASESTPTVPISDPARLHSVFDSLRGPLAEAKGAGSLFNAWAAAGLKRDEVRNAAVMASLLDPRLCPATGPAFLQGLVAIAGGGPASVIAPESLRRGYMVRTEDCPLGGGENRVDISIEGAGFLLFIEVKIDAGEGHAQLERYDGVLRAKANLTGARPALIYLSPRSPAVLPAHAAYLTWADVATAARKAGRPLRGSQRTIAEALLTQFAVHAATFKGTIHAPARPRPTSDPELG